MELSYEKNGADFKNSVSFMDLDAYLTSFSFKQDDPLPPKQAKLDLFLKTTPSASPSNSIKTKVESSIINGVSITKYINEFWTAKQRQASSIHEISYRACFKPQLPRFFINLFTSPEDVVYDPFTGRGTTIIEAALMNRNVISNDINPLSRILTKPRLTVPTLSEIKSRLELIDFTQKKRAEIDLSMFYHIDTEAEIIALKNYLLERKMTNSEDYIDEWIRMVATNRLTGHSPGFFSVYTLPPNQAVSPESQIKINIKRNQTPPYRNVKEIILNKSKSLLSDISNEDRLSLAKIGQNALFFTADAQAPKDIPQESVQLTVTSPPFLDIVQYSKDNWLRCWFNSIPVDEIEKKITMSKTVEQWSKVMSNVFKELFRITRSCGWVAFEVGEVNKGKIQLEDIVIPVGIEAGFECFGVLINLQEFTKTSNIWGINNNSRGTNTNRIALFHKP
jgi:hypothetical protein